MNTLLDIFNQFESRADDPAFVYRTGVRSFRYTYKDLHEQSLQMATWLQQQGIQAGDRVVIWAPNSPLWGICYWGCVLHGVIVVPVDVTSDKARAESITELSKAKLVIQSHYKLEGISNSDAVLTTTIEDLEFVLPNLRPYAANHTPASSDAVELVYTSGTTGNPKGVVLTHKNLITNINQLSAHIDIKKEFTFLSALPLSHMFEQMIGFLLPLARGSRIIYMRTLKPSAIMSALEEEDVSIMPLVPRLLQVLKTGVERELTSKKLIGVFNKLRMFANKRSLSQSVRKKLFVPVHKKFGKGFKFFVSGGAALDIPTAAFWNDIGFTIVEGYGLTECSPVLAAHDLTSQKQGTVGKPVLDVNLIVREGEILAKGENIFTAYWENQEATKLAFTEDGWFKTGDRGAIDAEGLLSIRGREKEMIVTGAGVNIYPDDIEPVLNAIDGVKESCVIGLDKGHGEEVHAVVLLEEQHPDMNTILDTANKSLDTNQQIVGMSEWTELEFPKTTTLKVKKFQVKEWVLQSSDHTDTTTSDRLIALIANVTSASVGDISEDTIITSLGLSSLARLELTNMVEQEYRLDLDDTLITQTTTVADLRAIIAKREKVTSKTLVRRWTNHPTLRFVRMLVDRTFHRLVMALFMDYSVKGKENINLINEPVIFIANHVSIIDHLAFMKALPAHIRYNTASATAEEIYFPKDKGFLMKIIGRIGFEYVTVISNAFALPQKRGFRDSMKHMGHLIDRGTNIFIFPEGQRCDNGTMGVFQNGVGIMTRELKVPVIPMKVEGLEHVLPKGTLKPKRAAVTVTIGKPLVFTNESPSEIVAKARLAIESL